MSLFQRVVRIVYCVSGGTVSATCLLVQGKENGVKILKLIVERPFPNGTLRETLIEGTEGAPYLGPERPRVYSDLTTKEKERYNADIRATNFPLQGLPKDIYSLINHYTNAKDMMQLNSKFVNNLLPEWDRFITAVKLNRGLRDSNYDQLTKPQFKTAGLSFRMFRVDRIEDKGTMHGVQVQLVIGELITELGGQDNDVDEDVDEQLVQDIALNVDNMFQVNDCDAFDFDVDEAPTAQTMFMANISFAYLFMMKPVHLMIRTFYLRRPRFELTEREQKIDEQLRIVITDRNIKEENLKKELHSVKMQFASTINHNKSMYTQLAILEFRDTLIQHMESVKKSIDERAQHKREYDGWVNERLVQTTEEKVDTSKALDASFVDTKSSGTYSKEQDTSSRSGNDAHDDDTDIRPIYDAEPMVEDAVCEHHEVHEMHDDVQPNYVKENPKKDKIRSKPDKNGRRGETRKSQKQL
nr:hypothetical protein [Tanacetum cinerariifolium]